MIETRLICNECKEVIKNGLSYTRILNGIIESKDKRDDYNADFCSVDCSIKYWKY